MDSRVSSSTPKDWPTERAEGDAAGKKCNWRIVLAIMSIFSTAAKVFISFFSNILSSAGNFFHNLSQVTLFYAVNSWFYYFIRTPYFVYFFLKKNINKLLTTL